MKSTYTPAPALIAAAPDLLAALKEAVAAYGTPGGPWNVPSDPGGWISRAQAAIENAEWLCADAEVRPEPAGPVVDAFFLAWVGLPAWRRGQLDRDDCYQMFAAGWVSALSIAATVVEQHDKTGREWIRGSLWDDLTREAAGRIRALIPEPAK